MTKVLLLDHGLYLGYKNLVEPSIEFDAPSISDQKLPELLNDISLMNEVGYDYQNPPPLAQIIPAIQEKLSSADTAEEYHMMVRVYDLWLYFLYGFESGLQG